MSIAEEFLLALGRLDSMGRAGQPVPPSRLAVACTAVLPVAGVGICLFGSTGFPLPIGASDQAVATAERLQFTAGQGPGLDAHSLGCTMIATESLIAQEWPMYYQVLVGGTPFRAITAVPLNGVLEGAGMVDLYFHSSRGVADLNMTDTEQVITEITTLLTTDDVAPGGAVPDRVSWSDCPTALARSAVVIAMEVLSIALHVSTYDALTLLRARAYATDRSVDDIAADLMHHRITTSQFRPHSDATD